MGSKLTTEIFIDRSSKIHNVKYDYSNSNYIKQYEKIIVICPEHGEFTQIAKDHMCGYGCPQCGIERNTKSRTKTNEQFILDSMRIHGRKYNYNETQYTGVFNLVSIKCEIHGIFFQRAHDHLNGCGCPSCTKSGYKSTQKGYIYIQTVNENVYKLGITNNPEIRIEQINSKSQFNHRYYKLFSSDDGKLISLLERQILNVIPHGIITREEMKDGFTETFSKEYLNNVMEMILINNLTEEVI